MLSHSPTRPLIQSQPEVVTNSNHPQSAQTNPPSPAQLNHATLMGKGNFAASPMLKTIGAALIPIGVATIGFGGVGIFIIVIGISLWVSGTMTSAHESVRPKGQSFSAHIAESIGWAILGVPLVIGSYLTSHFCSTACDADNPPKPALLNRIGRCCKKLMASPVVKNIAGAIAVAGTGAAFGCPVLASLLIGVGVGTSWIGGAGVLIAAVGIGLWIISTRLSMQEKPQEQAALAHIAESAGMAVTGIPTTISSVISDAVQWCRSVDIYPEQTMVAVPEGLKTQTTSDLLSDLADHDVPVDETQVT